jgi:hypothetical protein
MGISAILKGIIKNTDSLYTRMEEITYEVIEPLIESGLSRAEAVAETVLGLLRIGEGKYVTNELLESADKSYLVDNYDLPLDEISTLARAKEQGFDLDKPMYRGRSTERGSPESLRAKKIYTVDDPSTALTYSKKFGDLPFNRRYEILNNSPNVDELVKSGMIDKYVMRPLTDESGNIIEPIVIEGKGSRWAGIPDDATTRVGEIKGTLKDIFEIEEGRQYSSTDDIGRRLLNTIEEYGKDEPLLPKTVVYEDIIDEGPHFHSSVREYFNRFGKASTLDTMEKPSTVRMDLDKSTIRKAYNPEDKLEDRPRFDPRLRYLKNLLASAAPVAVSLGALSELKEEPQ